MFLSRETEAVFYKLRSGHKTPLKQHAEISVGLQTSADNIYIFEPVKENESTFIFTKDDIQWEVEKNICRPCIYNLSFGLFDTIRPNSHIIFPYTTNDDRAEIIDEATFLAQYPLCWNYLIEHKELLKKRSLNGNDPLWYQFGRSQSLTRFQNSSKLIWHVLSTKPTYVLDEINLQFTGGGNGPYYALLNKSNYSILYFMAILSHPLFENMVKAGASEFRGAYYSHGKQFIENLPIKDIDTNNDQEVKTYNEVVKTIKYLISTKAQYFDSYGAKRKVLQRKLDILNSRLIVLINCLYGINEDEFNIVLKDEMLTGELIDNEE